LLEGGVVGSALAQRERRRREAKRSLRSHAGIRHLEPCGRTDGGGGERESAVGESGRHQAAQALPPQVRVDLQDKVVGPGVRGGGGLRDGHRVEAVIELGLRDEDLEGDVAILLPHATVHRHWGSADHAGR